MATRTPQAGSATGVAPTMYAASPGGDRVPAGSRLVVVNGGGGSINLTIAVPATNDVDGLVVPDRVVAIPNGSFPAEARLVDLPSYLKDPSDGLVGLSWSGTTSVTFGVLGAQRT